MHAAAAEARRGGVTIPRTGVRVVSGHAVLGTESRPSAGATSVFITSAPSIHSTPVAYNWNIYAFALTLGWKLFIYSADQTLIKTHYSRNSFTEQAPSFLCRECTLRHTFLIFYFYSSLVYYIPTAVSPLSHGPTSPVLHIQLPPPLRQEPPRKSQ